VTAFTVDKMRTMLEPFHPGLTDAQLIRFCKYAQLLMYWNQKLNLTTVSDPEEVATRHLGESILASTAFRLNEGRLADVGAGAGFPGLPLKIVSPDLDLALLEPNAKKCAFLTEVYNQLSLDRVTVIRSRYEDCDLGPASVDFLVSRALGNYKQLIRWAPRILKPDGLVILWLGAEDSLLVSRSKGWNWDAPILIPGSRRRVILAGRAVLS
jgi:16S rRNA (guanine527-N7)-methyltransferase